MSVDGSSLSGTDRTLLEGLLAVRMGMIEQSVFRQALDAWQTDPSRSINDILRDLGCIDARGDQVLEAASQWLVEHHGGDVQQALGALIEPPASGASAAPPLGTTVVSPGQAPPPGDLPQTDAQPEPELEAVAPVATGTVGNGPMTRKSSDPNTAPVTLDHPGAVPLSPDARTVSQRDERARLPELGFQLTRPSAPVGGGATIGGRYQILNLHAKGNLGEVFRARDHEVGREVALKRIQARHADIADRRDQFEVEARITGGLEHPGIVPVYSLGKGPDGRPFYAMRLIRGQSLRQAIGNYHTGPGEAGAVARDPAAANLALRSLIRRFVDVCEAMAYAHSRGVVHRDIKPSNIMLGEYGETLVVDWGLAKAHGSVDDPSSVSAEGPLTIDDAPTEGSIPGVKGTIPYMSPEQARGEKPRPSSDIYSLGGTLYSILTGRLPYEGTDSQEMLAAVRRGEHRTPRSVRRDIPPILEAICLKAMAVRPEDRYASARALAEDLNRWIDDEPVLAYSEPWPERLARWARKHQAAVGVTTATVAMLALASIPLGILFQREADARRAADRSNTALVAQRGQTERQFLQTRALVDQLTSVIEGSLLLLPGAENFRKIIVDEAAARYEGFLSERPDDRDLASQAAQVFRVAANSNRLLELEGAADGPTARLYDRALKLYERLAPERVDLIHRPALTLVDRGEWHRMEGRLKLAERDYRAALERSAALPGERRDDIGARLGRGMALMDLAGVDLERGHPAEAAAGAQRAIEEFQPLVSVPAPRMVDQLLMLHARRLKLEAAVEGDGRADREEFERLVAESAALLANHPDQFDPHYFHATLLMARERLAGVEPAAPANQVDRLREAFQPLFALYQRHRSIPFVRRSMSEAYAIVAERRLAAGQISAARQNAAAALSLARQGRRPDDRALEANALVLQGRLATTQGDVPTARALFDQALATYDLAIADRPESVDLVRHRDEALSRRDALTAP